MIIHDKFRFISYIASFLLLLACGNDDNDSKNEQLQGSWVIQNKTITVWPRPGEDEAALRDSLTDYTFFNEGSVITFQEDSLRMTIEYMEWQRPAVLPYSYHKSYLKITPPNQLPLLLEGSVELQNPVMQFTLTTESYMSILQLLHPSFYDRILSANVSYFMQRQN